MEDLDSSPVERRPVESRQPLRRSRDDKVLAGVCGGLGKYLGVDPVWLRIAFVALALGGGSGLLLYFIAVLAIPEEELTS